MLHSASIRICWVKAQIAALLLELSAAQAQANCRLTHVDSKVAIDDPLDGDQVFLLPTLPKTLSARISIR